MKGLVGRVALGVAAGVAVYVGVDLTGSGSLPLANPGPLRSARQSRATLTHFA
jgi:hypothetical protein